jgi:guanine nucleotide-binding protein subunit beta-2-like 1 protein
MTHLSLRGILKGHNGWVTSIATPEVRRDSSGLDQMIVSASRDRSIIQWRLGRSEEDPNEYGRAQRRLRGHSHYIQDVVLSRDGQYALTGSWDKSLRLWDLNFSKTSRKFFGHSNDVLSVAFSIDNRQIVSGSRDKSIKLWNTLGECKCSIDDAHNDWVSCVKFSPNPHNPVVVSAGWDKLVKVWSLQKSFKFSSYLTGHTGYVNSISIAPDGSLCATGGKEGSIKLWDLNDTSNLYSLEGGDTINALSFSPNKFWLAAATDSGVRVFDLQSKDEIAHLVKNDDNEKEFTTTEYDANPNALSISWASDGLTLYTGYTDGIIRVWSVSGGGHK